jgi:predicted outer membrane repeat protein
MKPHRSGKTEISRISYLLSLLLLVGLFLITGTANATPTPGPTTPFISSVVPSSAYRGDSLDVLISGANFTGATGISFGAGISVNGFTVYDDANVNANITIDAAASPGTRDVSVTTPDGTGTNTAGFIVLQKFQTIYVNGTTGSNSYDGSSPVHTSDNVGPKQTIAAGIDAVTDNGTVNVAAGTYHEHGLHLSQTMNLIGAGALSAIIDGDALGHVLEVSSEPGQQNTISGFTIRNGAPSGSYAGGGIYISSSHIVTINDCAIINNSKGDGSGPLPEMGGGVCNDGGALYMNRCTVSGNTANHQGGGIYTNRISEGDSGLTVLTNCTLSGNTVTDAGGGGGGIYCGRTATMRLTNVTIANNQATGAGSYGGGFANASPSSAYFKNCIVTNNTAGNGFNNNGFDDFGGEAIHSLGHNIDSENTCFFVDSTDQINTNPQLGPLQNNGGQTSTCAITTSSPAFNRGICDEAVPTDQRGVTRPQGASCDIGAFELVIQQVATATGTGIATFTINNGSINNLTASATTPCGVLPGFYFPEGFFSFNITNITVGSTVTITITFPDNIPANTQYWKCTNGQWVNVTSLLGDNDGDNILTLTLTDGGLGDADGAANGTIIDPGGPAVTAAPTIIRTNPRASPMPPNQLKLDQFSVQYLSINPQQAAANQPITITTNAVNNGDNSVNYNVALMINGSVEQTRMVSVGPRSTQPVKFTVSRAEPGTYSVDIADQKGSFTILGTGSETPVSSVNVGLLVILFIGVLVMATILIIMLIFRRGIG